MAITYKQFGATDRRNEVAQRLRAIEEEHFRLTLDTQTKTNPVVTPGLQVAPQPFAPQGLPVTGDEAQDSDPREDRLKQLEADHKTLTKLLTDLDKEVNAG